MNVLRAACCVLVGLVLSCGSEDGPPVAHMIEKVSGDSQFVDVLTSSAPLVVRVVDLDDQPAAGVAVKFAVTVGTGSVTVADTTDGDGLASAIYLAGTNAGNRKVRAQITEGQLFFDLHASAGPEATLLVAQGQDQGASAGTVLPTQLGVKVVDAWGRGIAGAAIAWAAVGGAGSVSVDTTLTDANGVARVIRTLGPGAGGQFTRAIAVAAGDTLLLHSTAKNAMTVLGGGSNVTERYTSDLWVTATNAYTGTWGFRTAQGRVLKVWDVAGAPVLVDSVVHANVGTISDDEVSADGSLLLVTAEGGGAAGNGLYVYSLTDPVHPLLLGFEAVPAGLHTGTFAVIGGQTYVFASKDPGGGPALMGFRFQPDSTDKIATLFSLPQGGLAMHDQYYRDGLLFASVWNNGLKIYDVGDGRQSGSPSSPQLVGALMTGSSGLSCNCVHNTWWYHDTAGANRYVFVGQEGPGSVGSQSSGDIHVVDVSNMAAPKEVAFYHMGGAGVHNFWMDETRGILYAAYYNGGVVALDVTGTLSGDLFSREIARLQPGGPGNTYVWGVMLANGALWASDMVSGFWKLSVP